MFRYYCKQLFDLCKKIIYKDKKLCLRVQTRELVLLTIRIIKKILSILIQKKISGIVAVLIFVHKSKLSSCNSWSGDQLIRMFNAGSRQCER
jgi:hypothetical protein